MCIKDSGTIELEKSFKESMKSMSGRGGLGRGKNSRGLPADGMQQQGQGQSPKSPQVYAKKKDSKKRLESRTRNADGRDEDYKVPAEDSFGVMFDSDFSKADLYAAQQLYRRVEPTREWIENNYYKLLPTQQNAQLVTVCLLYTSPSPRDS